MDIFDQVFIKTGVTWDTFVAIAGVVYALVEMIKAKFKTLDGTQVRIVNALVCIGVSLFLLWGNWPGIIIAAVFSFFGADALHVLRFGKDVRQQRAIAQNGGNKNNHSQLSRLGDQN